MLNTMQSKIEENLERTSETLVKAEASYMTMNSPERGGSNTVIVNYPEFNGQNTLAIWKEALRQYKNNSKELADIHSEHWRNSNRALWGTGTV